MIRHEEIRTADINLAASITTVTNRKPGRIAKGQELAWLYRRARKEVRP
jgi:hypothetical protein